MSPTLLRIVLTAAPLFYRLVRWIERNINSDS